MLPVTVRLETILSEMGLMIFPDVDEFHRFVGHGFGADFELPDPLPGGTGAAEAILYAD